MSFTLSIFLYLYYAFLALWFLFSLIGLYHILKFSQINFISFMSLVVYTAVSMIILNFTYFFLTEVDWEAPITVLGGLFQINSF